MKKKITVLSLFLCCITVIKAQNWNLDFEATKEKAQSENKNILIVFQGSDWCVPCIKLERKVWQSDVFKEYAQKKLLLQKADFPKRKKNKLTSEQEKRNNELSKKYNQNGYFPHVVLVNRNGKVLKNLPTQELNPEKYIDILKAIK